MGLEEHHSVQNLTGGAKLFEPSHDHDEDPEEQNSCPENHTHSKDAQNQKRDPECSTTKQRIEWQASNSIER